MKKNKNIFNSETETIRKLIKELKLERVKAWTEPTEQNYESEMSNFRTMYEELVMRNYALANKLPAYIIRNTDVKREYIDKYGGAHQLTPDYITKNTETGEEVLIEVKSRARELSSDEQKVLRDDMKIKYGPNTITLIINTSYEGINKAFPLNAYPKENRLLQLALNHFQKLSSFNNIKFSENKKTRNDLLRRYQSLLSDIAPILEKQLEYPIHYNREEQAKLEDSLNDDIIKNLARIEPWVNQHVLLTKNMLNYFTPSTDGNINPDTPFSRKDNYDYSVKNSKDTHKYGHQAKFLAFHLGMLENYNISDEEINLLADLKILPFQIEKDKRLIQTKCAHLISAMKYCIRISSYLQTEADPRTVKLENMKFFDREMSRVEMIKQLTEFKVELEVEVTRIFKTELLPTFDSNDKTTIQFNKHGATIIKNTDLFEKAFAFKDKTREELTSIHGVHKSKAQLDPSECLKNLDQEINTLNTKDLELPLGNFYGAYNGIGNDSLGSLSDGAVSTSLDNIFKVQKNKGFHITYAIHTLNKTVKGNVSQSDRKFESHDSIIGFQCPHTKVYTLSTPAPTLKAGPSMVHFGKINKRDIAFNQIKWIGPIAYVEIDEWIYWYNPRPVSMNWEANNASDRFIFGSMLIATTSIEMESNLHKSGLFWSLFWNFTRGLKGVMDLIYLLYKSTIYQGTFGRHKISGEFAALKSNDLRISHILFKLKKFYNKFAERCYQSTKYKQRQFIVDNEPVFGCQITGWNMALTLMYLKSIYPKADGADKVHLMSDFLDKEIILHKEHANSPIHYSKVPFNKLFNFEQYIEMLIIKETEDKPILFQSLAMYDPAISKFMRELCKSSQEYTFSEIRKDIMVPILNTGKNSSVLMPEGLLEREEKFANYDIGVLNTDVNIEGQKHAIIKERFLNNELGYSKKTGIRNADKDTFDNALIKDRYHKWKEAEKQRVNAKKVRMDTIKDDFDVSYGKKDGLVRGIKSEKLDIAQVRLHTLLSAYVNNRPHRNLTKKLIILLDEISHLKKFKTILFKDDSQLTSMEMALICSMLDAGQVILSMELKEETKYGKRVFFVQSILNKIQNMVYDLLMIPLLTTKYNDVDIIHKPGLEKQIAIQSAAINLNIKLNNMTTACDITRYGDSMLIRQMVVVIRTCSEEDYITKNELIFLRHVLECLLNRKIVVPLDIQKKIAVRNGDATNIIDGNLSEKFLKKYTSPEMTAILYGIKQDTGLNKSLYHDLLYTLKIMRDNGGTLGVFNKSWSVPSSIYVMIISSVLKDIFVGNMISGKTLSDDNLILTLFELVDDSVFDMMIVEDVLQYYRSGKKIASGNIGKKGSKQISYYAVWTEYDNIGRPTEKREMIMDPLFGSKCSKLYLVLMILAPRLVSNQPSPLKTSFGPACEITQTMIANNRNSFAPLIRWMTTLTDNLGGQCPYYDTMDAISKCYDLAVNGGTVVQVVTAQIIANLVVTIRYGLSNRSVDNLPQNMGLFFIYPDYLVETGFSGNLIRLLAKSYNNPQLRSEIGFSLDTPDIFRDHAEERVLRETENKFFARKVGSKDKTIKSLLISEIESLRTNDDNLSKLNINTNIKPDTLNNDNIRNLNVNLFLNNVVKDNKDINADYSNKVKTLISLTSFNMLNNYDNENNEILSNIEVSMNMEPYTQPDNISIFGGLRELDFADHFRNQSINSHTINETGPLFDLDDVESGYSSYNPDLYDLDENNFMDIEDNTMIDMVIENNTDKSDYKFNIDDTESTDSDIYDLDKLLKNSTNIYSKFIRKTDKFQSLTGYSYADYKITPIHNIKDNILSTKPYQEMYIIIDTENNILIRDIFVTYSMLGVETNFKLLREDFIETWDDFIQAGLGKYNLFINDFSIKRSYTLDRFDIMLYVVVLKRINFEINIVPDMDENQDQLIIRELEGLETNSISIINVDNNILSKGLLLENYLPSENDSGFKILIMKLINEAGSYYAGGQGAANKTMKVERENLDDSFDSSNSISSFVVFPIRFNKQAKAVAAYKDFREMVRSDFIKFAKDKRILVDSDDPEELETTILSKLSLLLFEKTISQFIAIVALLKKMRSSKAMMEFKRMNPDFLTIRRWGYLQMWISIPFNKKFQDKLELADVITITEYLASIEKLSKMDDLLPSRNKLLVDIMMSVNKESISRLMNPRNFYDFTIERRYNPLTKYQLERFNNDDIMFIQKEIDIMKTQKINDSLEDQLTVYSRIKYRNEFSEFSQTDMQLAVAQLVCMSGQTTKFNETLVMEMVPRLLSESTFPELCHMMQQYMNNLKIYSAVSMERFARPLINLLTPAHFQGIVKMKMDDNEVFERSRNSFSFRHYVKMTLKDPGAEVVKLNIMSIRDKNINNYTNIFLYLIWGQYFNFFTKDNINYDMEIIINQANEKEKILSEANLRELGSKIRNDSKTVSIFFSKLLLMNNITPSLRLSIVERNEKDLDGQMTNYKFFKFSFGDWPTLILKFHKDEKKFSIYMADIPYPQLFRSQWDYAMKLSIFLTRIHGNSRNYFSGLQSLMPATIKRDQYTNEEKLYGDLSVFGDDVSITKGKLHSVTWVVKQFYIKDNAKILKMIQQNNLYQDAVTTIGLEYHKNKNDNLIRFNTELTTPNTINSEENNILDNEDTNNKEAMDKIGFGLNTIVTPWYFEKRPSSAIIYMQSYGKSSIMKFQDSLRAVPELRIPVIYSINTSFNDYKELDDMIIVDLIIETLDIKSISKFDKDMPIQLRKIMKIRRLEHSLCILYHDFSSFLWKVSTDASEFDIAMVCIDTELTNEARFSNEPMTNMELILKRIRLASKSYLLKLESSCFDFDVSYIENTILKNSIYAYTLINLFKRYFMIAELPETGSIANILTIRYTGNDNRKNKRKSITNEQMKIILDFTKFYTNNIVFCYRREQMDTDDIIVLVFFEKNNEDNTAENDIRNYLDDYLMKVFKYNIREKSNLVNMFKSKIIKEIDLMTDNVGTLMMRFSYVKIINKLQLIMADDFDKNDMISLNKLCREYAFDVSNSNKIQPTVFSILFRLQLLNPSYEDILEYVAYTFLEKVNYKEVPDTFVYDRLILEFLRRKETIINLYFRNILDLVSVI
jgi:hypothetical protein